MKIETVVKNVKNDSAIREFIERKVHYALDRINARVKQVTIRLEVAAGHSNAFDGRCHIDVAMLPTGHIHVSASGGTTFDSVLQATQKMEHAIKHDIDRHRRSARVRHQKSKQRFYSSLDQRDWTPDEGQLENQNDEFGVAQG